MTRVPGCVVEENEAAGLKKGPWTPDEDQKLVAYIQKHGHGSWRSLPLNAGLQRCGKSCRLRWTNYLRPDIKRGRFSQEEDQMIVHLHAILGNRWSAIASHLPRRTDNEIKNYWNTHLKKRLLQLGIDPVTHKSTTATEELVLDSGVIPGLRPVVFSNLTHMSQWDCARAEAEARLSLSRQSSLLSSGSSSTELQPMPPSQGGCTSASTSFMSTWKAQVAATLRPSFGVVALDPKITTASPSLPPPPPNSINLQTFLQDWESSLTVHGSKRKFSEIDRASDLSSSKARIITNSDVAVSGLAGSSGAPNVAPASAHITATSRPCEFFPPSQNIFPLDHSDSQGSSSFDFPGMCEGDHAHRSFSPTSTLHAPDYDSSYTNSPCVSSGADMEPSSTFDLLAAGQSSFSSMFPGEEEPGPLTFWSRHQQVAMVEHALQAAEPAPYYSAILPVNDNNVNISIPQFDHPLC